jgi:hypothetical protein
MTVTGVAIAGLLPIVVPFLELQMPEAVPILVPAIMLVIWVISLIESTPEATDFPGHHEGAAYYGPVSRFRSSPERLPRTENRFRGAGHV